MELLKLLSSSEIVAQVISFLLVFFLLRAFAWKTFLKLLDDRKERIAREFKDIEGAKADIHNVKAKYDALLQAIEETARARMREVVAVGEVNAQEIRERARQEAERIIEDAKKEIQYELSKSREELKTRIVELTMQVAESVIQERLTPEEDRRLIEGFLKNVDKLDESR